ncbi:LacI family DNA-binding transcriptional regulator [Agrococcus jenensis]|uniref:LacI family transcriptional regulator n=1 Tax=Agrococcus jenensis TaxID=46353 RepID=A0A3N2AQD2_9MICO|nr:LacI family DNA-binding transcriptional regulator [Agrococcus jenensis]ROR65206.1 LacI family transcriptional regulator [Agrococcus jenensis]
MTRVRLTDVAARAGVSMKTVSNVVHHHPHVSPAMRARVQEAIDELGYRPNLTARRLATGRTGMIALAMPEIDHPYFSELSRSIAEVAAEMGYRVLIEQTLGEAEAERAVIMDREAGLVDGVIFHPVSMTTVEIGKLRRDLPLVLLGESARPLTTDHVMIDNVQAARDGTELLRRTGRRIAFLGTVSHDVTGSTAQRLHGYQEALELAGVPGDTSLVLETGGFRVEDARAALSAALARGLDIDAVLCRDDRFAIGALQALAEAGLSVPDDVAVLGWDDTHLATISTPTLSSIAPDKRGIARIALELLIERIGGHQGVGRHRIAPHGIEQRQSTAGR